MVKHPNPPLRELVDAWDREQLMRAKERGPAYDQYWASTAEGVGRMLRAIRAHKRFSQRVMAGRTGLSKTTYAAAELGQRELTVSQLARAVMLLGWVVELRSPDGSRMLAEPKDAPRDSAGRRLPARVEVIRVNRMASNCWGKWRWVDSEVRAPDWTFRRPREPAESDEPAGPDEPDKRDERAEPREAG